MAFDFFKTPKPQKISTLDPEQERVRKYQMQAIEGEGGPFEDIYAPFNYDQAQDVFNRQYREPAYQQFQENIVPTITGQFRGNNLQDSSYAGEALSRAGRDVERNLDSEMSRYLQSGEENSRTRQQNFINNFQGQNSFGYQQPQPSAWDTLMQRGMQFIGGYTGLGNYGRTY